MSIYTDATAKPGAKGSGTDPRQLYLKFFGGLTIQARDAAIGQYKDLRYVQNVAKGKSWQFPIIGRKNDAVEHIPGELIVGGTIENNEIEVTMDNFVVDSVFIAEIDELLIHFEIGAPFAHQLGQSLGRVTATRLARMHILSNRFYDVAGVPTNVPNGQVSPGYFWNANLATDPAQIEAFGFAGRQFHLENDMSGEDPHMMLPWQQYLMFARYFGVTDFKEGAGSGNKVTGKVGNLAGMGIEGTNWMPRTNVTTGNPKYQGDFTKVVGHISSKMAVATVQRKDINIVRKVQEERLGTLMIASQLDGHGALRPECSYVGQIAVKS